MDKSQLEEGGRRLVFCAYIVRNGKRIYPKRGKCFRFYVDGERRRA